MSNDRGETMAQFVIVATIIGIVAMASVAIFARINAPTNTARPPDSRQVAALSAQVLQEASSSTGKPYSSFARGSQDARTGTWAAAVPDAAEFVSVATADGVTTLTVGTERSTCTVLFLPDGVGTAPGGDPVCVGGAARSS